MSQSSGVFVAAVTPEKWENECGCVLPSCGFKGCCNPSTESGRCLIQGPPYQCLRSQHLWEQHLSSLGVTPADIFIRQK